MKQLLLAALVLLPNVLAAQSVTTGISRDTVRVGDPVRVILRVDNIPAGADVVLPDSLAAVDDVENAGKVRLVRDTVPGGGVRITAAYPVILWRPGETALPVIPMIVRTGARESTMQVTLPAINVVSVLPPDTTGIEPKPPKDVWGADRVWWPWILAAVLLLLAIAALIWWWRRRQARQVEVVPEVPAIHPRDRALRELAELRAAGYLEHNQLRLHYIRLSEILRAYAMSVESDWSTDLTTDELAPRVKRRAEAAPLVRMLRSADAVKFARHVPPAGEAKADLDNAEAWVREFPRPVPQAEAA